MKNISRLVQNLISLLLLSTFSFLSTSCVVKSNGKPSASAFNNDNSSNIVSLSPPATSYKFLLEGRNSITRAKCEPFTLKVLNIDGVNAAANLALVANLSGGQGAFFSDSDCANVITSTSFSANQSAANVYYRNELDNSARLVIVEGQNLVGGYAFDLTLTTGALLQISDAPLYDFGPLATGVAKYHSFTVQNIGVVAATTMNVGTNFTDPYKFRTSGNFPGQGGSCQANMTLNPGDSCTVVVSFSPVSVGSFFGLLHLTYFENTVAKYAKRKIQGTGSAQGGSLDISFGTNGIARYGYQQDEEARALAIQTDGKLINVGATKGTNGKDFIAARLLANGQKDTSFGASGFAVVDFTNPSSSNASDDIAMATAIQSDGKILVAGTSNDGQTVDFALARFDANGSLDATYGNGGKVNYAVQTDYNQTTAMALQADQKAVVAGFAYDNGNTIALLARFQTDGTLDATFGNGGKAVLTSNDSAVFNAVAIQSDGKIVAVGRIENASGSGDIVIARFFGSGAPDTDFGDNGKTIVDVQDQSEDDASSVALLGSKIYVGGTSTYSFTALRLETTGILDDTFGNAIGKPGVSMIQFEYGVDYVRGVAVQSDGKVVLAGQAYSYSDFSTHAAAARLTANGELDPLFGSGGRIMTSLGTNDDGFSALKINAAGGIVCVGTASFPGATGTGIAAALFKK